MPRDDSVNSVENEAFFPYRQTKVEKKNSWVSCCTQIRFKSWYDAVFQFKILGESIHSYQNMKTVTWLSNLFNLIKNN